MAAPRHVRKSSIAPAGVALVAALTMLGAVISALPTGAATTEYVVVDRNSGLAINGFDPVAYFTNAAPMLGKGEFEYRHAGVVWRFRNPGNRSAFAADPDVYMPRFGGYDPIGIGRRAAVPGDPRVWLIAGDRLFLFYSVENRAAFATETEEALAAAEREWASVQSTLSP